MALPSVTVVFDPDGGWRQPAGSHAWWMGDASALIRQANVDAEDGVEKTRHALSLAGPEAPELRAHIRDAQVAFTCAHQHLERARRLALQ